MSEADQGMHGGLIQGADQVREPLHTLRHARESAGLHIAALAAALKVPVRKLEALEAGRYEELPDLTFARALALSACRQLKVDPRPILEQLPLGRQPMLGPPGSAINAPFKPSVPGAASAPAAWFFRPSVLIAAVLTAAALVLLVLPEFVQLPVLGSGSTSSAVEESGQSVENLQLRPSLPEGGGDEGGDAAGPEATPPAPETPAEAGTTADTASPAPAPPVQTASSALLRIAATDETWVEVANGAGAVVAQRVLKAGDVIEYSSSPPYKVILGRAEAARVSVRGQPLDVMPHARNSVARFEVK